jgi:hypothetical protein
MTMKNLDKKATIMSEESQPRDQQGNYDQGKRQQQ